MSRGRLLALAAAFEGGALALAWGIGAAAGAPPFARLALSGPGVVLGLLAGAALFLPVVPLSRATWPPLERLAEAAREIAARFFADASLLDLAIVSILAGVAEEALFRGTIQTAVAREAGIGPGIAVAALLFGLAHPITPAYVVSATILGAAMGGLLAWTGDLAAPILAHALYDFLALLYLTRRQRSSKDYETAGSGP